MNLLFVFWNWHQCITCIIILTGSCLLCNFEFKRNNKRGLWFCKSHTQTTDLRLNYNQEKSVSVGNNGNLCWVKGINDAYCQYAILLNYKFQFFITRKIMVRKKKPTMYFYPQIVTNTYSIPVETCCCAFVDEIVSPSTIAEGSSTLAKFDACFHLAAHTRD